MVNSYGAVALAECVQKSRSLIVLCNGRLGCEIETPFTRTALPLFLS